MPEMWVIWSEEHGAWWAPAWASVSAEVVSNEGDARIRPDPGKFGYTRSLSKAGRYSEAEAREIAENANRFIEPPAFNEVAMPDPLGAAGTDRRRPS